MVVGKDETVSPDDEARAFALHWLGIARTAVGVVVRLILEKEIVESRVFVAVVFLRDFDDHDTRGDDFEDLGEGAVQLMDDILPGLRRFRGSVRRRPALWLGEGWSRVQLRPRKRRRAELKKVSACLGTWTRQYGSCSKRICERVAAFCGILARCSRNQRRGAPRVPALTRLLRPLTFCSTTQNAHSCRRQNGWKRVRFARAGLLAREVPAEQWNDWQWQLKNRVTSLAQLEQHLELSNEERNGVLLSGTKLALAVTPHFFNLIERDNPNCPIRRQVIPRDRRDLDLALRHGRSVRRRFAHARARIWCTGIRTACSFS